MLFDLRGRGRRRAVQVIYATLALLMGGGLVLFGIGGATDGGLLNAFDNQGASVNELGLEQVRKAEKKVRADRENAQAWAELARARVSRAATVGLDRTQGKYTEKGLAELAEADRAWQKALALTDKPDPNVATLMVQAYGQGGLNQPKDAVRTFEIALADRDKPTAEQYAQYAVLAYQASQITKGDKAAARAVELTDKPKRRRLEKQLEQYKTQIITQQAQEAQKSTSTTIQP